MSARFRKTFRASSEVSLQITSMADIFTIILVFLLKSNATSLANITPSSGMKLPAAHGSEPQSEMLKLEISENAIQIENKFIAPLHNFRFSQDSSLPQAHSQAQSQDSTSSASKAISTSLEEARKRQDLISKANPDVKPDSKILIVSDERAPYSTLKTVLAAAALNGFTDFKLVVIKKE